MLYLMYVIQQFNHLLMEEEMKKSKRFLLITGLFCALIIFGASTVMSAQQVKIPYVISDGNWWTGIAITNNADTAIEDMKLFFTTKDGASGHFYFAKTAVPPVIDPSIPKDPLIPVDPVIPHKLWVDYESDIATIAGGALAAKSIDDFYAGTGSASLPSTSGSVILSHPGDEKFSVTVYVGNSDGFAFQVFESTAP